MSKNIRVGVCREQGDVFWTQVHEAIYRRSLEPPVDLITFGGDDFPLALSLEDQKAYLDEIASQELDVLIGWNVSESLICRLLDQGLPIVHLSETTIEHPLCISPIGLREVAEEIAEHLAGLLNGEGLILVVGGLLLAERQDDGRSRMAGIQHVFAKYPGIQWHHVPTYWDQERAYAQLCDALEPWSRPFDAILGLSDSLAVWGREAVTKLGLCDGEVLVAGINGDPLAVAAIMNGCMAATIETSASALGKQAFDLAYKVATGKPYPLHYGYASRLITPQNVAECAAQKLVAVADLPSWLVRSKQEEQHEYVTYLKTSLHIGQQIGSVLDDQRLPIDLASLIKTNYGYDHVQLLYWSERTQTFINSSAPQSSQSLSLSEAGILAEALTRDELLFIPDAQRSFRFEPDPLWPDTRSRVIIPIRHGAVTLGLLDLHAFRVVRCTRFQRAGLQSLADQIGVVIQNARLYQDAIQAKAAAEKADQLKTRLLANLSHDLRHPLHLILSFADKLNQSASLPEVKQIERSARHLLRLVNDLLDLSRAEIDELSIRPEIIEPVSFLSDVFKNITDADVEANPDVTWRLMLPDRLPVIQADPDRLEQIVTNLLSNASKFTAKGHITLGAELESPYLHVWVEDTGIGIRPQHQESIFGPFVTADQGGRRREGVGLGLSITRRLVALHRGHLTLESRVGQGSVFHVYLPLPNLAGIFSLPSRETQPVLLVISKQESPTPEIQEFCINQGLEMHLVRSSEEVDDELNVGIPAAIAWDISCLHEDDWELVRYLRSCPQICTLPFLLYGQSVSETTPPSGRLTSVMLKPLRPKSLLEMVNSFIPRNVVGPILIVDDDPEARALYADMVNEHLGAHVCRTACGGKEAVAIMSQDIPQLVILDLMMPDMDGFQVIEWMRANKGTTQVPVVILSGKMLTLDDIQRLEPHRRVVLQTKNVLSDDELASVIQRILTDDHPLQQQTSAIVKRALAYIHQNYDQSFSRSDIAQCLGINENYLSQVFRQELGISPWEYLNRYRVTLAKEWLYRTSESIACIAARVGFDDPAYFSRVFRRYAGQPPSAYRSFPEPA